MTRPLLLGTLLLLLLSPGGKSQEEGLEEIIIRPRTAKKEPPPRPSPSPSPTATPVKTPAAKATSEAPVTPPPASTRRALPFKNVINTVDREAKLITIGKKKFHILHIRPETRIERIDGKPGTFEDLQVGQEIRGSYRKLEKVEWEAVSLKYGSKADAEEGSLGD